MRSSPELEGQQILIFFLEILQLVTNLLIYTQDKQARGGRHATYILLDHFKIMRITLHTIYPIKHDLVPILHCTGKL